VKPIGALALALVLSSAGCHKSSNDDAGGEPDGTEGADAALGPGADATASGPDGGVLVPHDGGSIGCARTCQCPQGLACLEGQCRSLGVGPVYCCAHEGCPTAAACIDEAERPNACPGPDGGPGRADIGVGAVGASCDAGTDCTAPLSCWAEQEPPGLYGGYCALDGCPAAGCPAGTACITFSNAAGMQVAKGCMRACASDTDCRSGTYCRVVPQTAEVCYPNCRDDILDCTPPDGTEFCDRIGGRCTPTTIRTASAAVGDPCDDSRDCALGQACLGETSWGIPAGMCTRICAGDPSATPCGTGETCQSYGGLGMCFKDCAADESCPARIGAVCAKLVSTWSAPSCIPQ
jgi:hypothetical protein